jgi:type III secretion system FlhB-like substrate exporter
MKTRLISRKYIEKAYIKDEVREELLEEESVEEKVDKLPKEMFQILGEVISFIEKTNKLEGDKNHEN